MANRIMLNETSYHGADDQRNRNRGKSPVI